MSFITKIISRIIQLMKSQTFVVVLLTGFGMVFALIGDLILAFKIGANSTSDAVIIALMFPLFIDTILREGAKFSLIPLVTKAYKQDNPNYYFNRLFNSTLLLGLVMFMLSITMTGMIIKLLGPGLGKSYHELATNLFYYCSSILLIAPSINLLSVFLNYKKKFRIVALRNTLRPLIVIIAAIIYWQSVHFVVIYTLAYFIGFLLYFLILLIVAINEGFKFETLRGLSKSEISDVLKNISWPTAGFVVRQISRIIEKSIATFIMPGGVSIYYYAFRVFSAIQTIIGSSIATISISRLTDMVANKKQFEKVLRKSIIRTVIIIAPIILVLLLIVSPLGLIIINNFVIGTEFYNALEIFKYFIPGLLFFCLLPPLNSALYALEKNRRIFYNMLVLSVINILLAIGLSYVMGLGGIAISVSLSSIIGVGISLFYLKRYKVIFNVKK